MSGTTLALLPLREGGPPLTRQPINSQIVGGTLVGQEELLPSEEIVANTPANRRQFVILYGGHMVLTNQRLVFLPGRTASQRPNVSLNLDSIMRIREKRMRFALVLCSKSVAPLFNIAGLAVETTGGDTHEFQLGEIRTGDSARWMEMLTKAITNTTNGGS